MKHYRALDGIRGVAIILVLIWHYLPRQGSSPQWLISSVGLFWSGVDLFFVLSGFLIGSILLQNVSKSNYFSTFYIRRAARILPLYLLVLSAFIVTVHFKPQSLSETYSMHLPFWSYLTFTQNFFYAARGGFDDPLIDVTWSLAIEEQFYIVLSLLIRKLSRIKLSILVIVLILLAPILRFYSPNLWVAYCLPLHRADSLMLGVLLALIWQWDKGREFFNENGRFFLWTFAILFLVVINLTYRNVPIGGPLGHFWLALFYFNFVLLVLVNIDRMNEAGRLGGKILGWFGLRSYGIYMLHKPLLFLVRLLPVWYLDVTFSPWITVLICLVILFPVAELSYRVIEKPAMDWGHQFHYK